VSHRADTAGRFVAGNGSTYSFNVSAFLRTRDFFGQPLRGHVMPPARSVDIDTADDLELARFYGSRLGLR
jgi:CMP-N-acetylneuraminic acid synthetase